MNCIGTAMTDENGRVVFLSAAAQQLFAKAAVNRVDMPWNDLFALDPEDTVQLQALIQKPPAERAKIPVHLDRTTAGAFGSKWMSRTIPATHAGRFSFSMMSLKFMTCAACSTNGRSSRSIGQGKAMQLVYQQIRDVARVDSTVLIEGETGTGKELVARAIHASSHRKNKPFIAVNCAGLTESLLSSQLFGHKRGAFTGAIEDHQGLLEAANGGTLLLDEIGDIPLTVQNQLLRVLQEREITRLGESRPRKIDVRVLAATHRSLSEEAAKGSFRSDLFYRIRVARISLPPLRTRREDIPLLAASFLAQFSAASGKRVTELSHDALRLLADYHWPGNVRELRSAIEFAVIRCQGAVIQPVIYHRSSSTRRLRKRDSRRPLNR